MRIQSRSFYGGNPRSRSCFDLERLRRENVVKIQAEISVLKNEIDRLLEEEMPRLNYSEKLKFKNEQLFARTAFPTDCNSIVKMKIIKAMNLEDEYLGNVNCLRLQRLLRTREEFNKFNKKDYKEFLGGLADGKKSEVVKSSITPIKKESKPSLGIRSKGKLSVNSNDNLIIRKPSYVQSKHFFRSQELKKETKSDQASKSKQNKSEKLLHNEKSTVKISVTGHLARSRNKLIPLDEVTLINNAPSYIKSYHTSKNLNTRKEFSLFTVRNLKSELANYPNRGKYLSKLDIERMNHINFKYSYTPINYHEIESEEYLKQKQKEFQVKGLRRNMLKERNLFRIDNNKALLNY